MVKMYCKLQNILLAVAALPLLVGASAPLAVRRVEQRNLAKRSSLVSRDDVDPTTLYPEHNISVPVDHFHSECKYEPHSDAKFPLRYWFSAEYYKEGGPVIVLTAGETSGVGRLPFLQKGIVYLLTKATNGIGVILEHRYYGTSFPFDNVTVENLRFLTTDQAIADTAYFSQNVVFKGLENKNLTSYTTPWIIYGGSYAGAFVAIAKVKYPNVFWGAISSSGVTEAIYDYWKYYEPIAQFGPQTCIKNTKHLINAIDRILLGKTKFSGFHHSRKLVQVLKNSFGLGDIKANDDFTNALATGIYGWQSRNWDPALNYDGFSIYCGNVSSNTLLYPALAKQKHVAELILFAGGYGREISTLTTPLLNFMGWMNVTAEEDCGDENRNSCFTLRNATYYQDTSLDAANSWRSWAYQYCTQWGFFQTGSGEPKNQLPIVSRTIDLEYTSLVCRDAFNITTPSDVNLTNQYGGFNIAANRLAIIDGQADPWRQATPHADAAQPFTHTDSLDTPFYEIPGAIHHWDENGLFPNETTPDLPPASIRKIQAYEVEFVKKWLQEAKAEPRFTRK